MSAELKIENCNVIMDLLPLYVDGALSEDSKVLVSDHLTHCSDCSREYVLMKKELNLEVRAEKITAPINQLKKTYFHRVLKGVLASVVVIVCLSGIICGWLLWPAFHGFTTFDHNNLSVSDENGKIVIIPDLSASDRQLHYIYRVNDDNTITMYFSFGTARRQYLDALQWDQTDQNVNWIIEPQSFIKSETEISFKGGTYTDMGVSGSLSILDDVAAVTLPEQVREVYYVSDMPDSIMCNWARCMDKNREQLMEQLMESVSMDDTQTYYLVPTEPFDFESIPGITALVK